MARPALVILHALWAAVAGASVTAQLCVTVVLNSRSPSPIYHSFYVVSLAVLLGGLLVMPGGLRSKEKMQTPRSRWSMLGGMCVLPSCFAIPAGRVVGVQLVMLVQLIAMLSTALVFDVRRGRVSVSDWSRLVGLGAVVLGTAVDECSTGRIVESFGGSSALLMMGVFTGGIGFAFQAKCNRRLSSDLGSACRATAFSALISTLCSLPVDAVIYTNLGVDLSFDIADWALWMFLGCQSAFYIRSLAVLPETLGYTGSYLALLSGKLVSSSAVDAAGLAGHVVPFTALRGASLAIVLAGAALFSARQADNVASKEEDEDAMLDLLTSPFTSPRLDLKLGSWENVLDFPGRQPLVDAVAVFYPGS